MARRLTPPDGKGGYFIPRPHGVLGRLKAIRRPGELWRRDPATCDGRLIFVKMVA
jgi:hypothetical protein